MESKTLTFEMEKETKNTVRFQEQVSDGEPVSYTHLTLPTKA